MASCVEDMTLDLNPVFQAIDDHPYLFLIFLLVFVAWTYVEEDRRY